jgi:hypothetical protein
MTLLTIIFVIVFLLFPIWTALHAWRKEMKKLAAIIGITYLIPFAPQLIALIVFFKVKPYKPNYDYIPSPQTYAGCGTRFFGATDRDGDSFITTQWFCLFYVPLIPIQSFRVSRTTSSTQNMGAVITTTTNYSILDKLTLHTKQVLISSAFILSFFFVAAALMSMPGNNNAAAQTASSAIMGLLVVYVIAGIYLLRAK